MIVIAERHLLGDYGRVAPGEQFEAEDNIAQDLLERKLVRLPLTYDKKVIVPTEVKKRRIESSSE